MSAVTVNLPDEVLEWLEQDSSGLQGHLLELLVFDLYREGKISNGRGAQILGWDRTGFIKRGSQRGIPFTRITKEELLEDIASVRTK